MLTNQLVSYYNHLLAASIMYLTMVDPLKDIANTLSSHMGQGQDYSSSMVLADSSKEHNYYDILGVKKDATKQEIHRAFRQLAKKYHPDKNKDKSASDEFIKIFKAYETLSDEKKRKEYDERANGYQYGSSNTWAGSNMNNFDINEFFQQYEEQFMRHAQYHQDQHANQHYHHQGHPHNQEEFRFHGINLDNLFDDIDEDEFMSFSRIFNSPDHNHNHVHANLDGHFGDGDTFFGSHFPSQLHDSIHHYEHQRNMHGSHQAGSLSCQTIKRNVGGMIMTQTSCS
jgi:curved DNA-binding protein CbpA